MPEGESIHRAAIALRTALVGKPTVTFRAPRLLGPAPTPGRTIESVRSHGKHLEIMWDDGLTLHTHLRLTGSWHLYRSGERWRKRDDQMRVSIEVRDWIAVCFSAPVVETYRQFDRYRHPGFGRLGPDLCRANADIDECIDRMLDYGDPSARICEVLLDQHVACGVGNVFRCEVLWAVQLSPFATVGSLSEADAAQIINAAARMLRAKLSDGRRSIRPEVESDLAVYGRNGQRCGRCGGTIQVKRIGEMNRLLYWCPDCQARGDARVNPTPPVGMDRPMDPHPAAAMYLSDLPWRRNNDAPHDSHDGPDVRARRADTA
ncbi:MAG: DNA-formamidopyrimidine glycosylase family protein [Ilumatobacteraceae bacterium]